MLLTLLITLANLGLGYALAVHLGWGKWPSLDSFRSGSDAAGH
jgi:hypothetical protein